MNKILMSIVIEYVLFLETTDEKMLDPDLAMARLEEVSYLLKQLKVNEVDDFRRFVDERAEFEKSKGSSFAYRTKFLKNMFVNLGF